MDDSDELDELYDDLYCPACDKSFKTDKALVTVQTHAHTNATINLVVFLRFLIRVFCFS